MQSDMKMQDVMNLKKYLYACVRWILSCIMQENMGMQDAIMNLEILPMQRV